MSAGGNAAQRAYLRQQLLNVLGRAESTFAANVARSAPAGGPGGAAHALVTAPVSMSDQLMSVLLRAGVSLPAATRAKQEVDAAGVFSQAAAPAPSAAPAPPAAAPVSQLKKATQQLLENALKQTLPDGKTKYSDLTPDQLSELTDGFHLYGSDVTGHAAYIRSLQMALPGLAGGRRRARKQKTKRRGSKRRSTKRRAGRRA